ncbi:hypothetical protein D3C76_1130170 [compost metagenome]
MNVGNCVAVGELQRGVLFEERHHARSGLKEGIDHRRVIPITQFVFQVSAWLFNVFDDAGPPGQGIARYPCPATGPGGGAAQHRVFFHHYHLQAMPCRCHGGCQPGRAGADDQYITVDVGKGLGRHV